MMDVKTALNLMQNSLGQNLYEVKIPSTKQTVLFSPMTVGMRKSISKYSLVDDTKDYINFQFPNSNFQLINNLRFPLKPIQINLPVPTHFFNFHFFFFKQFYLQFFGRLQIFNRNHSLTINHSLPRHTRGKL